MATLVYKYGAWAPFDREEAQMAREIMVRANKHYNALVSAENMRRKMVCAGIEPNVLVVAHNEVKRKLRAVCGLRHGTYLAAEDAAGQAAKARPFPKPLNHRPLRSRGTIGEQFNVPLAFDDAVTGTSRFRLDLHPITSDSKRAQIRRKATVWFRVGSDGPGNRIPVWVKVHAVIHRLPPPGSVIRWAKLIRETLADRERWTVQLTVDVPDVAMVPARKACGIDVGWRKMPGGAVRAAYLYGDDDVCEELQIPARIMSRLAHADEIRAVRDHEFNQTIVAVKRGLSGEDVPAVLREATRGIMLWKRKSHLMRLWRLWQSHRFAGDAASFAELEAWRHQDRHLWQWEANERDGAIAARREVVRLWAHGIAQRYGRVAMEKRFIKAMVKKAKDEAQPVARQRQATAAGEVMSEIEAAVRKCGGAIIDASAVDTTATCHTCGNDAKPASKAALMHACSVCGEVWDQDENAARNLLTRMDKGKEKAKRATKVGGKWAERKRSKVARQDAAIAGGLA